MPDIKSLLTYLEQYFLQPDAFARAANIPLEQLDRLVAVKAIPGAIYKIWDHGAVWSPIGGQKGDPHDAPPDSTWYTPAALWPARQVKVLIDAQGLSVKQCALALKTSFISDFRQALLASQGHQHGYADLFDNQSLVENKFTELANSEWQDWINGGYGVCLKRCDGFHLVSKEVSAAIIRTITSDGTAPSLNTDQTIALLAAIDRLGAVMLPFAPYQRPHGTPGKWIDEILAKYDLGHTPLVTRDEIDAQPHLRLCV